MSGLHLIHALMSTPTGVITRLVAATNDVPDSPVTRLPLPNNFSRDSPTINTNKTPMLKEQDATRAIKNLQRIYKESKASSKNLKLRKNITSQC